MLHWLDQPQVPQAMKAVGARLLDPEVLQGITASEAATLVWAWAKLGLGHDDLVHGLLPRIAEPDVLDRLQPRVCLTGSLTVWTGMWALF